MASATLFQRCKTSIRNKQCCPYGRTMIVVLIVVVLATIFTWTAAFGCSFFVVDNNVEEENFYFGFMPKYDDENMDPGDAFTTNTSFHVGLWTVEDWTVHNNDDDDDDDDDDDYDSEVKCVPWSEHPLLGMQELDTPMVTARALGLLACLCSLIPFFSIILSSCVIFPALLLQVVAAMMLLTATLTLLMLIAFASDLCNNAEECHFGAAGVLAIIGFLFWFVALVTLFCCIRDPASCIEEDALPTTAALPLQQQPVGDNNMTMSSSSPTTKPVNPTTGERVTVREVHGADGSVTTITTTTNVALDGTTTTTIREEQQQVLRQPPVVAVATILLDDAESLAAEPSAPMESEVKGGV